MSLSPLTPETFDEIAVPIVRYVAAMADKVRPVKDHQNCEIVGQVIAVLHHMTQAKELADDARTLCLEVLLMDLATWIYRERQAEFEQFVQEAAELVVLDALVKMQSQPKND